MSLKNASLVLIAGLFLCGALIIASTFLIKNRSDALAEISTEFQQTADTRVLALASLNEHMGYGGMIHQFKNLVLRNQQERAAKVRIAVGGAVADLHRYATADISPAEKQALADIEKTILSYSTKIKNINEMADMGATPEEIDQVVKISDKPAIEGLATLKQQTKAYLAAMGSTKQTKAQLIEQMRAAIGYNGVIHQFKNYVLRKDEKRTKVIEAAAARFANNAKSLRAFPLTDNEKQAIANIESVINSYVANVDLVRRLASEGKSSREIDRTVKINDGPALAGFRILNQELFNQSAKINVQMHDNISSVQTTTSFTLVGSIIASLLLAGAFYLVMFRVILRPMASITKEMTDIAKGKPAGDISRLVSNNEIGKMAEALLVFQKNANEIESLNQNQAREREQNESNRKAELGNLASTLDERVAAALQAIMKSANSLNQTAGNMTQAADSSSLRVDQLSSVSGQATSNTESVATATEELNASIHGISQQMDQARSIAEQGRSQAIRSRETMKELVERSTTINGIIELINAIAEQTNLLALNATIEAARAGDAGKGFAIVASEVKELASQTANATEQISEQISALQDASQAAEGDIEGVADIIGRIHEISSDISSSVSEQSGATQEIASRLKETASGTREVEDGLSEMLTTAQTTQTAAKQVNDAAKDLTNYAHELENRVSEVSQTIRAA
ncbi:MAG: methyl-accepting chemotaxis protein [Cohaesibacter sp.]|jgi:methyl-accepting chemotaxis protein|nr:methyl-accepting chemotaxis protein [Cohaesibacter sp.]